MVFKVDELSLENAGLKNRLSKYEIQKTATTVPFPRQHHMQNTFQNRFKFEKPNERYRLFYHPTKRSIHFCRTPVNYRYSHKKQTKHYLFFKYYC